MSNKRSAAAAALGHEGVNGEQLAQTDTSSSDLAADSDAQKPEQETGSKRPRVQPSAAAAAVGVESSAAADAQSTARTAVSTEERLAMLERLRTCQHIDELQSIMAHFTRFPPVAKELPLAWAPILLSKLFDAPLPLPLQASILRVIAAIHPRPGVSRSGLDLDQKRQFVDRAIAVLGRSSDPADVQAFGRACTLASSSQFQTALPMLVATLNSDSCNAKMLCQLIGVLSLCMHRTFLRPLLLQFGVIAALVRRCIHPDPLVPLAVLKLFEDMVFWAQLPHEPFNDALVQSGILLEGRLSALLHSHNHRGHVLRILSGLQSSHASEVQPVVLECLPQLISCLSASSTDRVDAHILLSLAVQEPTTAEQRAAILASRAVHHLVRAFVPNQDAMEPIWLINMLQAVLGWEQCAVAANVLHPIAEEFVQMRFVPSMETLVQAPPQPADDCTQLGQLVSVARFLAGHVYNRLPLGLVSSQPHLGLTRQSSLTRRSCAAPQPQWFAARLEALEEQFLREVMRLQQVAVADELNQAAAVAAAAEDGDVVGQADVE